MPHVLPSLTLQCRCAEPALQWSLPCRGHPTICFCASEQYFGQHSHYLPLCVEGFFSDTLDTTRSVYESILHIWKLFVPHLHQASKCSKSLLKFTQLILKNSFKNQNGKGASTKSIFYKMTHMDAQLCIGKTSLEDFCPDTPI